METNDKYLNRMLKLARHIGKNNLLDVLLSKEKKFTASKCGSNIEHFA